MRHPTSTSYITPIASDGTVQTESATEFGRGAYTLTLGTTYYYPLGGQDTPCLAAQCQWDASIVLTSITVEDCNIPPSEMSEYASDAGGWIAETPAGAYVAVVGAGATVTAGVVAVVGGAQGGAMFQISDTGARRTRLKVIVGATGGEMRVAAWGKE